MDQELLIRKMEKRYISRRDMLARIPLGVQPDTLWQEMLNRRRAKATILPLNNFRGNPFWYVTTDRMVTASEKIVEALYEDETEMDPYIDAPPVATLEEVFYTSFVEGSQITMQAAMDFLTSDIPPRDIEEQMITNNRLAGNYASANLYRTLDSGYLRELVYILTDGIDNGGEEYRDGEPADISPMNGEAFPFPSPARVPEYVEALVAFLASPEIHPLIKASVAQAYILVLRPFPEGNERLGRMLTSMILLRAGYTFFRDISLSALIARRSYGYYEAMANILREENGGDMTYFIEYCLELLARAVDERRLRLVQKEEQDRQAEQDLAKMALVPPIPPDDGPGKKDKQKNGESEGNGQDNEGGEMSLEGYQVVSMEEEKTDTKNIQIPRENMKNLRRLAADSSTSAGKVAAFLLQRIRKRELIFTSNEIMRKIALKPQEVSCLGALKRQGIIQFIEKKHDIRYYRICQECDLQPLNADIIEMKIQQLAKSNKSVKDKRIGLILMSCLEKGTVGIEDYKRNHAERRWESDMRLAEQMGLVQKITEEEYAILSEPKPGIPQLNTTERKFITKMYGSFGQEWFSSDMVIATLDYSGAHIRGMLHRFTLIRILDCQKEDGFRYQFMITPEDHPECFENAA